VNEDVRTAIVVDGAALATLVASFATRASAYAGPELCLVKRFFKVRCAGCGLMRSFASLWEGNVPESFAMHPLGPVLFAALVLAPIVDAIALARGRAPVVPRLLATNAFRVAIVIGIVATLALPFQEVR